MPLIQAQQQPGTRRVWWRAAPQRKGSMPRGRASLPSVEEGRSASLSQEAKDVCWGCAATCSALDSYSKVLLLVIHNLDILFGARAQITCSSLVQQQGLVPDAGMCTGKRCLRLHRSVELDIIRYLACRLQCHQCLQKRIKFR